MTTEPDDAMREYAAALFEKPPEPEPTGDPLRDFARALFHNADLD